MVEKGQEPVAEAQVTKTATGLYVNLHKFILLQTAACIVSSTNSANTRTEGLSSFYMAGRYFF